MKGVKPSGAKVVNPYQSQKSDDVYIWVDYKF